MSQIEPQPSVEMPRPELSAVERQEIGRKRAGQRVRDAMALFDKVENQDPVAVGAQVRAMALAAMPKIMGNLIAMATGTGKHARAPAVAQSGAAKLVAGAAGIAMEATGAPGSRPLAEMGLGELESALFGVLDNVQRLRALEGEAQRVDKVDETLPISGSDAQVEPPTS